MKNIPFLYFSNLFIYRSNTGKGMEVKLLDGVELKQKAVVWMVIK